MFFTIFVFLTGEQKFIILRTLISCALELYKPKKFQNKILKNLNNSGSLPIVE